MLNLDKKGKNLCIIKGTGVNTNKIVSVSADDDINDKLKTFKSINLEKGLSFQQIPNKEADREIMYITGASGSGKSHYIAQYVREYQKLYKNNEIYLYSSLPSDETIDVISNLHRVKIDESLVTNPIIVSDFESSMIIFDDCDVIKDVRLRNAVLSTMNEVLEIGRHHKISSCISYHRSTGGKDTTRVLNECDFVVYFPNSGSAYALNYLLTKYVGLDKKDIKKIKNFKSRWCCVFKKYPQVVMTERNIFILAEIDD